MNRFAGAITVLLCGVTLVHAQPRKPGPTLDDVLRRMGDYIASYGDRAALIVAVERQTQTLQADGDRSDRPRTLWRW